MACDVRDADQVDRAGRHGRERHGRLDVVVNNAGGAPWADSATASPRFSERIIALNLLALLWWPRRPTGSCRPSRRAARS